MPRFFLHIFDNKELSDLEGHECATVAAARNRAIAEARELAAADVKSGHLNLGHRIVVKDEYGDVLFVVTFRDAVSISY